MFLAKLRHGCYQGCLVPYKTTNQGYLLLISSLKKGLFVMNPTCQLSVCGFPKVNKLVIKPISTSDLDVLRKANATQKKMLDTLDTN